MKILIIDQYGNNTKIKDADIIPRIGDSLDIFYDPLPKVTKVVLYPKKERLKEFKVIGQDIIAIIICK